MDNFIQQIMFIVLSSIKLSGDMQFGCEQSYVGAKA